MDTSPEYIKQCEKATEIQEFRTVRYPHPLLPWKIVGNLKMGDYYYNGFNVKPYCLDESLDCDVHVWLPRQDQLQEIIQPNNTCEDLAYKLVYWIEHNSDIVNNYTTLEQIWLFMVMEYKFNKIWNGNDWEKIDAKL